MRYGLSFSEKQTKLLFYIDGYVALISIFAILSVIIEAGFIMTPGYKLGIGIFYFGLGILFIADYIIKFILAERKLFFVKRNRWYSISHFLILLNIIIAYIVVVHVKDHSFDPRSLVRPEDAWWISFRALTLLVIVSKLLRGGRLIQGLGIKPVQLLVLSFLMLIITGTLLLLIPDATVKGISFIDALFTATSATCVTGLVTKSTAGDFTLFGQIVILGLIQAGGLGIMTITAFLLLVTRYGLGVSGVRIMSEVTDISAANRLLSLLKQIVIYTLTLEFLGAIILSIRWHEQFNDWGTAIYYGIFHAISAFCNAGFALLDNSLENYVKDPIISLTVAGLIICGSVGYLVVHDLVTHYTAWKSRHARRLGVQTRLTLRVTIFLLIAGTVLIWLLEQKHELAQYDMFTQWMSAFFQSVTARTAGFNTIPMGSIHHATLLIIMILMFIGGSSGSTAGGIKTSTVGVLLAQIRATIMGDEDVVVFERTIPRSTIAKAFSVTFASMLLVDVCLVVLLVTQPFPFIDVLFETISAFGTVGLSMGITPDLTPAGKIIITVLMYLGRVGPVSFFVAMGEIAHKEKLVTYPDVAIMVG